MHSPVLIVVAPSVTVWNHQMQNTQTPGYGCYTSTYPSNMWSESPCGEQTPSLSPPNVGGVYGDYIGQCACPNHISTASGHITTESGYQWETDSLGGSGWYSIQMNSNFYPINYCSGGTCTSTQGWVQFVFQDQNGGSGPAQISLWWWLVGGYSNSNPCPSGWTYVSAYSSCVLYWTQAETSRDPYFLNVMSLGGSATSSQDTVTYCYTTICNSLSGPDNVFLSNHWNNVEWNVFGYAGSSQASFNPGFYLAVSVSIGAPDPETVTCANTYSTTGETNNLNLDSCNTPYSSEYDFTEAVPALHCPPSC